MRKSIVFCFLLTVLIFVMNMAYSDAKVDEAIKSSKSWLDLIDTAKYAESWQEASHLFKTAISKEDWNSTIKGIRASLGNTIERKLKSSEYRKTMPGAPDGEYVVIQYETSFENKKTAVETITPMLDKDGKWRVAGYYIK